MSFETLLAFVLIEALLCLSPGPAVVLVIGLTVRYGCPMGFGAIAGILAANTFYFFLASIGVGAAIIASSAVFTAMKWIGAGYLVWLGVKMLTPVIWRAIVRVEPITPAKLSSSAARSYVTRSPEPKSGIRQGFYLQAANPKNIVFFVAVLPQFISPDDSLALQVLILGMASVIIECAILIFYCLGAERSMRHASARVADWVQGLSGSALIVLALSLLAYRRPE